MSPADREDNPPEQDRPPSGGDADFDGDLEELLRFVRDARGFDFTGYKRSSVARRVGRRIQAVGLESVAEYRHLLEDDVDEFTALFNTILINLTAFFRDPAAWRYLESEIVPALLSHRDHDQPIRIWSAGCATGEEPYTLAMVMAEYLGIPETARRVKIYGTDIDLEALAWARVGAYPERALADVPEALRVKYFQPDVHDRGFVIVPPLRRTVVFGRHDLTRDPPISHVDLLCCRNTLMYLNGDTQAFVIPRLHYSLHDGGYLFLGRSEMVLHGGAGRFTPVNLRHRIFAALPHDPRANASPATSGGRRPFDLGSFEISSPEAPLPPLPDERVITSLAEPAFELGAVAELLISPDATITAANEPARRRLGIRADQIGRSLSEIPLAHDPFDLIAPLEQVLAARTPYDIGVGRYRTTGGQSVDFEVGIAPLLDDKDHIAGARITFTDVSGITQLRDRYRRMHAELETAYEELQSTNEELVTSNEELQSSYEELETSNEELQSANEELETTNEELRSSNEELETTNVELKSTTDAMKQLNVSLVETNGELRRYSTVHRRVMDHLPSAVVLLNSRLLIEDWNRAATELWGLRTEEVLGEPIFGLDFGLPLEALQDPLRASRNPGASPTMLEVRAVDRSGQGITCRVSVVPITDDESDAAAMLIIDVLERASS